MKFFVKLISMVMAVLFLTMAMPIVALAQEQTLQESVKQSVSPELDEYASLDSDTLLEGYLEKQIYADMGISAFAFEAGAQFDGWQKYCYDELAAAIKEVAAGTRTSTVFNVSFESFSEQNRPKEESATDDKANKIIYALLADLPYELYWFDKVTGGWSIGGLVSGQYWQSFKVILYVSADYMGANNTTVGDKPAKIATAVANAKSIVETYKNETDFEKLTAYKNEICALVEYDYDAANGDVAYGDPWQLIDVFDGKTSTKVVCEGYSKAFKYLCDLTTFSGDVSCYIADGIADYGTNKGRHMWNVVEINNYNYLVDITNTDGTNYATKNDYFFVGSNQTLNTYTDIDFYDPQRNEETDYIFGLTHYIETTGGTAIYAYQQSMKDMFCAGYPLLDTISYQERAANLRTLTVQGGNGGKSYSVGASVTVTATPNDTNCFVEWQVTSGNIGGGIDLTSPTLNFTMPNSNVTIKAIYTSHQPKSGAKLYNSSEHWQECQNCNRKINKSSHDIEYEYDANNHWRECVDCTYKTTEIAHSYNDGYVKNSTTHQKRCICGKKSDAVAHDYLGYGSDISSHWNLCACGAKTATEEHEYTFEHDETKHWKECECGRKQNNTDGKHVYHAVITLKPTAEKNGEKTYTCIYCQRQYKEIIDFMGQVVKPSETDGNQSTDNGVSNGGVTADGGSSEGKQNSTADIFETEDVEGQIADSSSEDNATNETEVKYEYLGLSCKSSALSFAAIFLPILAMALISIKRKKKDENQ